MKRRKKRKMKHEEERERERERERKKDEKKRERNWKLGIGRLVLIPVGIAWHIFRRSDANPSKSIHLKRQVGSKCVRRWRGCAQIKPPFNECLYVCVCVYVCAYLSVWE